MVTTVVHFFLFLKVMIVNILRKIKHVFFFLLANIPHCSVLFPLGKYAQVTNNPEMMDA